MGILDLLMPELAQAEPYHPKQKMKPVSPDFSIKMRQIGDNGIPASLAANPDVEPPDLSEDSTGGIKQASQRIAKAAAEASDDSDETPSTAPAQNPRAQQFEEAYANILNDRKAAIDKLKERLGNVEANKPEGLSTLNLRPFYALADSLNDTKFHFNYQNPTAPQQYLEMKQKLNDAIASQSDKLSDDQLKYLKMKADEYAKAQATNARREIYGAANDYRERKLGQSDDRLALQAGKEIDNDSIIKDLYSRRQTLARDRHTLETSPIITPEILAEIQKGLAGAITGAKSATVSDTEAMKLKEMEIDLARKMQYWKSQPTDIGLPETKQYLADMIKRLDDAYGKNILQRVQVKKAGMNNISSPKAKAIMNARFDVLTKGIRSDEQEAIDWAKENPDDPRAQEILQMHGDE